MRKQLSIFYIFLLMLLGSWQAQGLELEQDTTQAFVQKNEEELKVSNMLYSFSAHKPFYLLPLSYNSTPSRGSLPSLTEVNHLEVKFQFSFKFNVIKSFYKDHMLLAFAYTNLSFWQLYNSRNSSPFRETNHEPELFLEYHPDTISNKNEQILYRLGFVHQSNGQDIPESRSWNRLFLQGIMNFKYFVGSLKVWHRFKEGEKDSPLTSAGDDNPLILDYMGNFELQLNQRIGSNTLTVLLRNNLKKKNRGAIEASWSFPLNENYKGYFQYFNGYGESLIDYNSPVTRAGIGIIMADWL